MYRVFDEETETHHSYKRKSNPFDERNYIVMRGWKDEGDTRCSMEYFRSKEEATCMRIPDHIDLLVGHNIKFDLLYEMCTPGGREELMKFFKRGGRIWCTQYAEYLLNGQQQKVQMVAMDTIIESYGGRKKIDGLKALWAAGVLTSDINPDTLEDYLIGTSDEGRNSGDIGNTELIYKGQLVAAEELKMLPAIQARMDGLAATTEMEFNGLAIDLVAAKAEMELLTAEGKEVAARLAEYVKFIPEEVGFKWSSNVHVSCLFFGGTIRYSKQDRYMDPATGDWARLKATARWPLFQGKPKPVHHERILWDEDKQLHYVEIPTGRIYQDTFSSGKKKGEGKFKSVDVPGEIKVKYQDFFYELPGITEPDPAWKGALLDGKGNPVYSTDKDVVAELGTRNIPFLKDYSRNAAIEKELGTYFARYDEKKKTYVGMLTCVGKDGIVHHSLNHVNTITTRLSSNSPNLQNLPRADKSTVKRMFISRFKDSTSGAVIGQMVEIDYSQLEVVVQGLLSGDKNLVRDLNAKIDFHCKRVALKTGCTYEEALYRCKDDSFEEYSKWKAIRTGCKEFSFQRAYGAGAAAVAASTGMDVEEIKKMIELEEAEYPGITAYNNKVEKEVNATAEPFRDGERGWRTFRRGTYQAPTGTIYTFRSYDAPAWQQKRGVSDTFMPTELKNYPIQGTGGEIVQMILGKIWRYFMRTENLGGKALLVNTVHDCYWIDTHPDVTQDVANVVLKIMAAVPQFLKAIYNIDCPVPFPAEAEHGPNMYDLKHFH